MTGYKVDKRIFKTDHWKKYCCPKCQLLLKDAVQPSCGHWLCQKCADFILTKEDPPQCPKEDCREELTAEDGAKYFPDRFVRKEIQNLPVVCSHNDRGCNWEGIFSEFEAHQKECQYSTELCEHCGLLVADSELEAHESQCPKAPNQCPCAVFGCSETNPMMKSELAEHLHTGIVEHMKLLVTEVTELKSTVKAQLQEQNFALALPQRTEADGGIIPSRFFADDVETDSGTRSKPSPRILSDYGEVEKDGQEEEKQVLHLREKSKTECFRAEVYDPHSRFPHGGILGQPRIFDDRLQETLEKMNREFHKVKEEVKGRMSEELKQRDEEIESLRTSLSKLERTLKAKNAEIEDRDFRLSLIENSNYDGTMVWKVPQFSQRMTDAQNGKYTSIFSLPFYTGRYGYKMCLRLYILGDGIGKNNFMSLFFVIMRGEFDNILPWPFSHKVTFKLINQAGGRDIVDTFQPDPMSSSFKKPKSDMNIASGCPRFVSHRDLKNSGFVIDDTIFIKCVVDRSTVKHP